LSDIAIGVLKMAKATVRISMPPFSLIAEHLARDDDFLADAKVLLAIDVPAYEALRKRLAEDKSFLDRDSLVQLVLSALGPGSPADEIGRIIWRFHRLVRQKSEEPLEKSQAILCDAIRKHSKKLSKEDREKLAERITALAVAPQSLARHYKAEQLAESVGVKLLDAQLICDIRPVFDESRSEIEGAIPVSTLQLDIAQHDGSSSRIEVLVTEQQVLELCEKSQLAARKLSIIKRLLSAKSIAVPSTSATLAEKDREP
jgi:hypothetical protein